MTFDDYLARIKQLDQRIGSFLSVEESAPTSPVTGGALSDLTMAIKDNILVKDRPATAGSKILEGFIAPYDATVVGQLKAAGAKIIGKTNLDEFGMGGSTENSAWQITRNPWDLARVPGGSSGGSAAAVAAEFCDASLGSDTGGSIRQPAAFCGLTGLKPSYGAVSRFGLIALASSLDVIGPIAKDAMTVERIFQVIAGYDKFDQTTVDYQHQAVEFSPQRIKIGLPKELWRLKIDPSITAAVRELVDFFVKRGAEVKEVNLPNFEYGLATYYVILPAEAMANLARYDGIRFPASQRSSGKLLETYLDTRAMFGPEVKRRILLGTYVLSTGHYDQYYQTAVKVKNMIGDDFRRAFGQVDVLITPTTPTRPFKIGQISDPLDMYQSDLMTVAVNLARLPALTLPCGLEDNLPIGGQLIAGEGGDYLLLAMAKYYQSQTNHHLQRPDIIVKNNG